MTTPDYGQCTTAELADTIGELHALLCGVQRQLLAVVAAYDRRHAWREDGATSMAAWLAYRLGLAHRTGAEWTSVATALEGLPALAEAFANGFLSFDGVAPLSRVATAGNDEELAAEAPGWSAAQCATFARRAKPVSEDEVEDTHRRRSLRWRWNLEERMLHLRGRLPAEAGAAVVQALEHGRRLQARSRDRAVRTLRVPGRRRPGGAGLVPSGGPVLPRAGDRGGPRRRRPALGRPGSGRGGGRAGARRGGPAAPEL